MGRGRETALLDSLEKLRKECMVPVLVSSLSFCRCPVMTEEKKGVAMPGRNLCPSPCSLKLVCSGGWLFSQGEETELSLLRPCLLSSWMWRHQAGGEVLGLRWTLWPSSAIHAAIPGVIPQRCRAVMTLPMAVVAGQVPPHA